MLNHRSIESSKNYNRFRHVSAADMHVAADDRSDEVDDDTGDNDVESDSGNAMSMTTETSSLITSSKRKCTEDEFLDSLLQTVVDKSNPLAANKRHKLSKCIAKLFS